MILNSSHCAPRRFPECVGVLVVEAAISKIVAASRVVVVVAAFAAVEAAADVDSVWVDWSS